MNPTQTTLFGRFPRSIGVTTPDRPNMELQQYLVHSSGELDGVVDRVAGQRNVYVSVSSYPQYQNDGYAGYAVCSDKVSYDFDSSAKSEKEGVRWESSEIPDGTDDRWVVENLSEPDVRESVLGDLCDEVREFVQESMDSSIPIVGVFSGFGLHIHQLYEETKHRVEDKLSSIASKWISELSLSTVDGQASGKLHRIMRYPDVERVIHGAERESTGIYTIALTGRELAEITPEELVDLSHTPRAKINVTGKSRPSMTIQEDYLGPRQPDEADQRDMRSVPEGDMGTEFARTVVKRLTRMPCVWKRALSSNPPNDVRVKTGIMLLNAGLSPRECTEIISQIGWVDFDWETTKYQLEKLYESGKGDFSCRTMQKKGLCVKADDKKKCEMYGYWGGNTPHD